MTATVRLTAAQAAAIALAPIRQPKPEPVVTPRHFCPDCGVTPVPPPRLGKDGRCADCRADVGHRRHVHRF